jgi:hypothetical protein
MAGTRSPTNRSSLMLSDTERIHQVDKRFDKDVKDAQFLNHFFLRLGAKDKNFKKVDFRYSFFENCYLRNCTFDSCDFTGCRFVGTNLHGARFSGCRFDYSYFEKTLVESDILDTECPGPENLRRSFARSLRMNYQQLGDAVSANKAITVELEATGEHWYKAWRSKESYYRKKYARSKRISAFMEWLRFKFQDFIWGNGESPFKLLRSTALILFIMSMIDASAFRNSQLVGSYTRALIESPQIFLGTLIPGQYPTWYLTIIVITRLIAFGLFMSIIIKRLNRR